MFKRKPKKLYTTEEGKLPKGYRHGDIIAGYLPCTIPDGHTGPCALPAAGDIGGINVEEGWDVRTYGFGGTIHQTTHLDISVDKDGNVTEVWYRCQLLPFKQFPDRGNPPVDQSKLPELLAVEVRDAK